MITTRRTWQLPLALFVAAASFVCSQDACGLEAESPESTPVFQADVDRAGTHQYTNYREPVVVRTGPGKIVVGVHAGNRQSWPERSGQDLAVRISEDNGKTWGPIIVAAEETLTIRNRKDDIEYHYCAKNRSCCDLRGLSGAGDRL